VYPDANSVPCDSSCAQKRATDANNQMKNDERQLSTHQVKATTWRQDTLKPCTVRRLTTVGLGLRKTARQFAELTIALYALWHGQLVATLLDAAGCEVASYYVVDVTLRPPAEHSVLVIGSFRPQQRLKRRQCTVTPSAATCSPKRIVFCSALCHKHDTGIAVFGN